MCECHTSEYTGVCEYCREKDEKTANVAFPILALVSAIFVIESLALGL